MKKRRKRHGKRENSVAAMTAASVLLAAGICWVLKSPTPIFGAAVVLGVQGMTLISNRRQRGEQMLPEVKLRGSDEDLHRRAVEEIKHLLVSTTGVQVQSTRDVALRVRELITSRDEILSQLAPLKERVSELFQDKPLEARADIGEEFKRLAYEASLPSEALKAVAPLTQSGEPPKDIKALKVLVAHLSPLVSAGYEVGGDLKKSFNWLDEVFKRLLAADVERPQTQTRFDAVVSQLQQEIHRGRKQLPELEKRHAELILGMKSSQAEAAQAKMKLESKTKEVTELAARELAETSKTLRLVRELQESQTINRTLTENLASSTAEKVQLANRLAENERLRIELSDRAQSAAAEVIRLGQKAEGLEASNQSLTESLAVIAADRSQLTTRLSETERRLSAHEQSAAAQIQKLQKDVQELRESNNSLTSNRARASASTSKLATRLSEMERLMGKEAAKTGAITLQVESQRKRITELEAKVEGLERELTEFQVRVKQWEKLTTLDFVDMLLEGQQVFYALFGLTGYLGSEAAGSKPVDSQEYYKTVLSPVLSTLRRRQLEKIESAGELALEFLEPPLVATFELFDLTIDLLRKASWTQSSREQILELKRRGTSDSACDLLRGQLPAGDRGYVEIALAH